jgi:hypothetical protein
MKPKVKIEQELEHVRHLLKELQKYEGGPDPDGFFKQSINVMAGAQQALLWILDEPGNDEKVWAAPSQMLITVEPT